MRAFRLRFLRVLRQMAGSPRAPQLPQAPLASDQQKRVREWFAFWALAVVFVLTTILMARAGRDEQSFTNSVVFFGVMNLNIILLMVLVFLFVRNTAKFFLERRRSRRRTRLQAKLIVGFVGFATIPTVLLFMVASFYISGSFDRWFSYRVGQSLGESEEVIRAFERQQQQTLLSFGQVIVQSWSDKIRPSALELAHWKSLFKVDDIQYYPQALSAPVGVNGLNIDGSAPHLTYEDWQKLTSEGRSLMTRWHFDAREYIQAALVSGSGGAIVLSYRLPVEYAGMTSRLASVASDYRTVSPLQAPLKSVYMILLLTMTSMIIFVALWVGIFLARQWTTPITRLIQGIDFVRSGNYDIKVPIVADDEIGILINAFNELTTDLSKTTQALEQTVLQKEGERQTLATVLSNMRSAVVLLDQDLNEVLRNQHAQFTINDTLITIAEEALRSGRSFRMINDQAGFSGVWSIDARKVQNGVLLVLEDQTDVMRAQREQTWREAARRVAHEIKNPLTPIRMAAERMRKRFSPMLSGQDLQILDQSTATIVEQAESLKRMVNEFSEFARMPQIHQSLNDLGDVIEGVLQVYRYGFPKLKINAQLDSNTPIMYFDRDGIKRVLINLIDNAREALKNEGEIEIRQFYNSELNKVRIEVSDQGPGIPEDQLSRIFEPYFSTKPKGSGLGLAIARRMILDHEGDLRVISQADQGTTFILELPTSQDKLSDSKVPSVWN